MEDAIHLPFWQPIRYVEFFPTASYGLIEATTACNRRETSIQRIGLVHLSLGKVTGLKLKERIFHARWSFSDNLYCSCVLWHVNVFMKSCKATDSSITHILSFTVSSLVYFLSVYCTFSPRPLVSPCLDITPVIVSSAFVLSLSLHTAWSSLLPQEDLCSPHDILDCDGLGRLHNTVQSLLLRRTMSPKPWPPSSLEWTIRHLWMGSSSKPLDCNISTRARTANWVMYGHIIWCHQRCLYQGVVIDRRLSLEWPGFGKTHLDSA